MSCSCHSSSTHMLSTTAVAAAAAAPGCIIHRRIGGMSGSSRSLLIRDRGPNGAVMRSSA